MAAPKHVRKIVYTVSPKVTPEALVGESIGFLDVGLLARILVDNYRRKVRETRVIIVVEDDRSYFITLFNCIFLAAFKPNSGLSVT